MTANKTYHVLITRNQDGALCRLTPASNERKAQERQSSLVSKYGEQPVKIRILTTQEVMTLFPEELATSLQYNK